MTDPIYGLSKKDIERIARTVIDFEQSEGKLPRAREQRQERRGDVVRLVIAQEDISPNTSGDCKFAAGTLGSETAFGDAYSMYYRTGSDAGTITDGSYCYAIMVAGNWELTPVECPE